MAKQQCNKMRKYFQMYFHYEKRTTNNSFKSDITTTSKSQRHLYLQLNQLKKSAIQGGNMKEQVQRIVQRGGLRSIELQGSTKTSMISNLYEEKYISVPRQSRLTASKYTLGNCMCQQFCTFGTWEQVSSTDLVFIVHKGTLKVHWSCKYRMVLSYLRRVVFFFYMEEIHI